MLLQKVVFPDSSWEQEVLFSYVVLSNKKLLYIVCNTQYEVSFFRVQTLESSDVDACGKVRDFSNNMSHSSAHYCIWAILSWVLQRKAEKR